MNQISRDISTCFFWILVWAIILLVVTFPEQFTKLFG